MGEMDSFAYLLYSALILSGSILPFCIAMGTTYPLMLAFVKRVAQNEDNSFSFLYMANVVGAAVGTLLTALVLVELLGCRQTLLLAVLANFSIAGAAIYLGRRLTPVAAPDTTSIDYTEKLTVVRSKGVQPGLSLLILFSTGFCSLGLEVLLTCPHICIHIQS
jgi:spermidine synthase